ncbi:unnamed protein product [Callosobruchus maculatus]|nr:unnamed protein product [Callosobruchus maculatus]
MFNDIMRNADTEELDKAYKPVPVDPKEAVATILYSSGTTGMPKGVMGTHHNLTTVFEVISTQMKDLMMNNDPSDALLVVIPIFHAFGFILMYINLIRGKSIVLLDKFQPRVFLEAIVKYRVTRLLVPPPLVLFLVKHPLVKEYNLSSLKEVRSGAAPLGAKIQKELKEKLHIQHISQAYGMTEMTFAVLISPPGAEGKIGSSGKVVPGMMAKVIDSQGRSLGKLQEGELCFKGPLVVKGYVGDPEATRNTIDKDGWIHTGDIGYYDEDGYFFIVDRQKELIKYKGFQVPPAELEALLISHACVDDVAVTDEGHDDEDDPSDALLVVIPLFHAFGFMLMYMNLIRGKSVILLDKFQPRVFLEAIVKYRVTRLSVPPPLVLFLVKHPLVKEYDLSSLKEVRSGAAPLGAKIQKELKEKLHIQHMSQAFGMTETIFAVLISPPGAEGKIGSSGKVVPGMMAKVIDSQGRSLGKLQEGELCFKGPLVAKGNTIDKDGWLHTGDIAYYDEDGYLFIVDRKKELIKYKGFQVAPAELEALLISHAYVDEAASHKQNIIQVDGETGESLTADTLLKRSIRLAKWFQHQGVSVGDCAAVNSENRLEFYTVPLTGFFEGVIFTGFNPEYTPWELKHVMGLSKPKVVFCSSRTVDKMLSILHEYPYVKYLVLFGEERRSYHPKVVMFNDIMGNADREELDETYKAVALDPKEAIATILYSSGTTGMPKGVMGTHHNMTAFSEMISTQMKDMMMNDDPSDALLVVIPLFHGFGFMLMYMNLIRGKSVVLLDKLKPRVFLEAIVKYRVTRLSVPPPLILFLVKHPLVKEYDLSSIKEVRSGAAPLSAEIQKELKEKFRIEHISQAYGMTETTLAVLTSPPGAEGKIGSSGQIVPGMMVKVIDSQGRSLGKHQEGELCFKGPLVVKGYVGDPEATRNTIDKDGWIHTGDIGYYDEDGYFFIVDRQKELIKYKGFQVAPAELEALLISHPCVDDVAVTGVPDEASGELPLAFVVRKPGTKLTEREVEKFVEDHLSPAKRLRGGVIFVDEIPRNPSGKILRRVLKERAKNLKSKL